MKISGFSIARDIRQYHYPVEAAIRSVLPICDEFVVNVGESVDDTLEIILAIHDPKIKIIQRRWDDRQSDMLSFETNQALRQCAGDWAFYVQADEVYHEDDLPRLKELMERHLYDPQVDAFRLRWLHFFGSYYRYRIDHGWFQKQDRIIRNNGTVESCTDAWAFCRKDGWPFKVLKTGCLLYHYGWVHPGDVMTRRRLNAERLWGKAVEADGRETEYDYGDLNRFPVYFGSHPAVMQELIAAHELSRRDWEDIKRRYWWHPARWLRWRYKTWRREKRPLT